MLHILDGESSARTLAQTNVPGRAYAWREVLMAGPTPSGSTDDEWLALRAKYLSHEYGLDPSKCEQDLREQEQVLASFPKHEEIVLWFEHDLFCQTNLLYVLNRFADRDLGNTRLSLVSIDRFPGIEDFRGLGQLNAEQLGSLFEQRKEVNESQLATAVEGWRAYCSADPTSIERFLATGSLELPFLNRAFELHLARFPSVRNGLGRVENRGLAIIAEGSTRFPDLFTRFGIAEPVYGLGDFQFWLDMQRLSDGKQRLLRIDGKSQGAKLSSTAIRASSFVMTETGERVLNSEEDFVELTGIDRWLGGVHLRSGNIWRWDDTTRRLVHETSQTFRRS